MRTATIQAVASYLPSGRLDNEQLAALYPGWPADKILEKTGIRSRAIAEESDCASDLAVSAAEALFRDTGTDRSTIDLLILCTQSPDYFLPTTACLIQERLGLSTEVAAFDFNLGCSGFPYGLAIAKGMLETGAATNALLLMAETYSKFIHPLDKSARTIFGDAATATLVTLADRVDRSIGPFVLGTDGRGAGNLIVPRGGMRLPGREPTSETTDDSGNVRTDASLYMNGPEIFEFTMKRIPNLVAALLRRSGHDMSDVDHFIFHQANEFMLRALQRKLRIPDEKFVTYLVECGNTVSSTIPIALERRVREGAIRTGDMVMLVGFGVGYSWGANLIRWQPDA